MENQKASYFVQLSVGRASVQSVLRDAIDDFLLTRRLERRSSRTLGNYRYDLQPFVDVIGPQTRMGDITPKLVKEYLAISGQRPGAWAHRARYNCLRAFFRWCVEEGYLPTSPLTVRPPKMPQRVMPVFSDADLQGMLDACRGRIGIRDKALLLVLMDTGMRLGELVGMRADHIDWDDGGVSIIGKGDKQRTVVLSRPSLLAVYRYLKQRGSPLEEIWLSEERRPLTASGVQNIIKRVSKSALGKAAGPHRFRHTYACSYLANGGSLDSLRYLLGHSSLVMVMRYAEATKAQRARVQGRLYSPVERLGLKA